MDDRGRTTTLAAFILLASALSAPAQVPLSSEFRLDTGTFPAPSAYLHTSRSAAMAPNGNFVVVWTRGPYASEFDVVARRFDAAGRPQGPDFLVNSMTTGYQADQAVGMDDAGNFVVVWAGDAGIEGQRFDAAGMRLGAEFVANSSTTGPALEPSIAAAPGGGFVVVWTSGNFMGPNAEVAGRLFDAAGAPVGAQFQVNTFTTGGQRRPTVGRDGAGNFVVVWEAYQPPFSNFPRAFAQRYSAAGVPQGTEFEISNSPAGHYQRRPLVAMSDDGAFAVAWRGSDVGGSTTPGVLMRQFDANGVPFAPEFRVDQHTTAAAGTPDLKFDADGDFVITWWYGGPVDGSGNGVFARRFDSSGTATGSEFRINTYTTGNQWLPSIASDPAGNFVITWFAEQNGVEGVFAQRYAGGLSAAALAVDGSAGPASDGNRVFEAGETVTVAPAWLNANFGAETFAGAASNFTGPGAPGDPTYTIADGAASYGTVPSNATGPCNAVADCYALGVSIPSARPIQHWDATFREVITPPNLGATKNWTLHIGDSFSDVPRASGFYRFVETVLHRGITAGCSPTQYCPAGSTTREQMAVFVLVAKDGPGNVPRACTTPLFNDVPASSPFCPWIEELARRGVVSGCGGGNYCPSASVSREQMAVFVLATKEPGATPPACGTPVFNDVPASSPFCRWIEELARRGVVAGCGGGNYCPTAAVTREQMAVFLSATFGLMLYGP